MLKRKMGAAIAISVMASVAAPASALLNAQPAHSHTFRSAESEALVAPLQRLPETRASRSELSRPPLPAGFLKRVGESLRAAERRHERLVAAAKARNRARVEAARLRRMRASYVTSESGAKAYAQQELAAYGWSSQWSCLNSLWSEESGWQVHDPNPTSAADGIPQANPASKMAAFGSDWRDNAVTQIKWGLWYIRSRYGSPCGAWDYHIHNGYY